MFVNTVYQVPSKVSQRISWIFEQKSAIRYTVIILCPIRFIYNIIVLPEQKYYSQLGRIVKQSQNTLTELEQHKVHVHVCITI